MPEGARAGELTLKPCSYDTEKGSYAADCGTLVVPENRRNEILVDLTIVATWHVVDGIHRLSG